MVTYRPYARQDREQVIGIINCIASQEKVLQTERYIPSSTWENLLETGVERKSGNLLIVVCDERQLVGFGRLSSDEQNGRSTGNIGILLMPGYRNRGVGTRLLKFIVSIAPRFGYENLTADILFDNDASLRLFQGRGFKACSSRSLYVKNRDAVVEEIRMQLSNINAKEIRC